MVFKILNHILKKILSEYGKYFKTGNIWPEIGKTIKDCNKTVILKTILYYKDLKSLDF
jgi:hypothetical protein